MKPVKECETGPEMGSERGSETGPQTRSERGSETGPQTGPEKWSEKGTEKGPEKGSKTTRTSSQTPCGADSVASFRTTHLADRRLVDPECVWHTLRPQSHIYTQ